MDGGLLLVAVVRGARAAVVVLVVHVRTAGAVIAAAVVLDPLLVGLVDRLGAVVGVASTIALRPGLAVDDAVLRRAGVDARAELLGADLHAAHGDRVRVVPERRVLVSDGELAGEGVARAVVAGAPLRAGLAAGAAVVRVEVQVGFAAVLGVHIAVAEVRVALPDGAHALIAGGSTVERGACHTAGAAVVDGVGVGLAAVGGHHVAVGEAGVAGGDGADSDGAGGSGVVDRTRLAAGAAVEGVEVQIGFAAVLGVHIAVAEVRVALPDGAHALIAGGSTVERGACASAGAAIAEVGVGVGLAAVRTGVAVAVAVTAPGRAQGHPGDATTAIADEGVRAGGVAGAAVLGVGSELRLAAIGVVVVAVAEAGVAGLGARDALPCDARLHRDVRQAADGAAGAAVEGVLAGVDAPAGAGGERCFALHGADAGGADLALCALLAAGAAVGVVGE